MPNVSCPHCGQSYSLGDEFIGRQVQCSRKGCDQVFVVPALQSSTSPPTSALVRAVTLEKSASTPGKPAPTPSQSATVKDAGRDDPKELHSNRDIARCLLGIGGLFTLWFFFAPTNVGKVENIGLLIHKVCGCLIGTGLLLSGVVLFSTDRRQLAFWDRLSLLMFLVLITGISLMRAILSAGSET